MKLGRASLETWGNVDDDIKVHQHILIFSEYHFWYKGIFATRNKPLGGIYIYILEYKNNFANLGM